MKRGAIAVLALAAAVGVGAAVDIKPQPGVVAAQAAGEQAYWVEELAAGLSFPWAMAFLPDGRMLITERTGKIRIFQGGKIAGDVTGVPKVLIALSYDGLFDIALDPDFAQNRFVYLTYIDGENSQRHGRIYKARLEGDALVDGRVIYTVEPSPPPGGPFMYRILFLPDKTMLVAIGSGDESGAALVQRTDNVLGKVIRLDRDGRPSKDNPFVGKAGYRPEIYALGLRNPEGMARSADGRLWVADIGPKGGDELNELKAGANYGWPVATWGFDYSGEPMSGAQSGPGLTDPLLVWTPAHSPSDLTQYVGKTYPGWNGDLFTGGLSGGSVRRIRVKDGEVVLQEKMLGRMNERFRSVKVGPDNAIYLLTDSRQGRLLRLRPGTPGGAELARVAKASGEAAPTTQIRLQMDTEFERQKTGYVYDPARGRALFAANCASCHSFGEFKSGRIGPDLNGVMGRRSGTAAGYDYSPAFRKPETQITWRRDTMSGFLAGPARLFPGTKMNVPGVEAFADRETLGDYLIGAPAGRRRTAPGAAAAKAQ